MSSSKQSETILISVYNHVCIVDKASPRALDAIEKHCTLTDGYFSGGRFNKTNTTRLFDRYDNSFPTGYLFILERKLEKNKGYRIDIKGEDYRADNLSRVSLNAKKLHEEDRFNQIAILEGVRKPQGNCGFVSSPTATGKSSTMVDIVNEHKVKTLIIVPKIGVRNQLAKTFSKAFGAKNVSTYLKSSNNLGEYKKAKKYRKKSYDINEDLIGENISPEDLYLRDKGYDVLEGMSDMRKAFKVHSAVEGSTKINLDRYDNSDEDKKEETIEVPNILIICYSSINSLPIEALEQFGMLIVDESQFAKCATIRGLARDMPQAFYRYAISATNGAEKENQMKLLCSVFGDNVIYDVSAKECAEKGIIKKTKFIEVDTACDIWLKDSKQKEVKGDDIQKLGIVGNKARNKIICNDRDYGVYELFHLHKRRILVEVCESRHAEILKLVLKDLGIEAHLLYAGMSSYEEDKVLKILRESTDPFVVIATTKAREGLDTVMVNCIWLAGVKQSLNDLMQWIGRGLRLDGEDDEMWIINPRDHFHSTLFKWSNKRASDYDLVYNHYTEITNHMMEKHGLKEA